MIFQHRLASRVQSHNMWLTILIFFLKFFGLSCFLCSSMLQKLWTRDLFDVWEAESLMPHCVSGREDMQAQDFPGTPVAQPRGYNMIDITQCHSYHLHCFRSHIHTNMHLHPCMHTHVLLLVQGQERQVLIKISPHTCRRPPLMCLLVP